MAYQIGNTTPAQSALNNKINPNPLNLSMMGNPNTVQPIAVNTSAKTSGTTTPQGISANPIAPTAGIVNPQKLPTATAQPYAAQQFNQGNTGGINLGAAQAPTATGASTGVGSLDPTLGNQQQNQQQSQQNAQQPSPQPYSATNPPTYPGLVGQLANTSSAPSADYLKQQAEANQYNQRLQESYDSEARALANIESSPHDMDFAQGAANVIRNQYLQQQQGFATAFQGASTLQGAANTQQGLQQSGLNQAAGLAAPQLAGFNQQAFNPLTQSFGSGSNGSSAISQLPAQAQTAIQSYAQQVKSGSMTRADAEGRLSAYGQPGLNALNEVLGSGFNTNASNASAGTTAQGQQIQTAAQSTNSALDTLSSAFANLNPLQTAGIPATNSIANWIGQQFGDQALQKFKTNLADARSQLIGVLNSSGGTPTGNEATAQQYLPDNMTKAQFDANVGTAQNPGIVRQLVAQKVSAFTQSGQQTNTNQNASSNIYSF